MCTIHINHILRGEGWIPNYSNHIFSKWACSSLLLTPDAVQSDTAHHLMNWQWQHNRDTVNRKHYCSLSNIKLTST